MIRDYGSYRCPRRRFPFAVREQTDHYCASVAPIMVCVLSIVRLPRRSVSRNVSRKLPLIAVPGDHHREPLHLSAVRLLAAAQTVLGKTLIDAALIWLRDTPPYGHDRVLRRSEMIEAILAERNAHFDARKAAKGMRLGEVAEYGNAHPSTWPTA